MRLLIVDDHTPMRRTLRDLVACESDVIEEAADGDTAVASYETFRPDWTIMDLQLPRLNGLEATRRILRMDPTARVVIVTGNDDPGLGESAEDAGASGFVTKDRLTELQGILGRGRPKT